MNARSRVLLPSNDLGEALLARTRNSSRKLRRGWRPSPLQKAPVITEDAHTRTQTLRSLGWRETQWSASFFQDIREGRNNEKRGNRPPTSRTPTKRLLFFFFHVEHAMPSSKAASTQLGAEGLAKTVVENASLCLRQYYRFPAAQVLHKRRSADDKGTKQCVPRVISFSLHQITIKQARGQSQLYQGGSDVCRTLSSVAQTSRARVERPRRLSTYTRHSTKASLHPRTEDTAGD